MSDSYLTLASPSEAVFTEKRSKFLAFAFPAKTTAEVKEQVDALSRKYYDARHVCWAYMLGFERTDFRANDNGEPSGTAGRPILGQINSLGLTDVCVVVVRYFGGIKLGTPGLIAAYRESARLALEAGDIVECHVTDMLEFTYPYAVMNDVMKAIRQPGIKVLEQTFDNTCMMKLEVYRDLAQATRGTLDKIDGLTFR